MLTGGCFCGAIRYEAQATPSDETICHCRHCRRTTGAPFVAWFTVPRSRFRFVQGTPARFSTSSQGTRGFCPRCGTQLTFENGSAPGEIDITTCSLDDPEQVPPMDHTYTRSKLAWIHLADGLPTYAATRSEGDMA